MGYRAFTSAELSEILSVEFNIHHGKPQITVTLKRGCRVHMKIDRQNTDWKSIPNWSIIDPSKIRVNDSTLKAIIKG